MRTNKGISTHMHRTCVTSHLVCNMHIAFTVKTNSFMA